MEEIWCLPVQARHAGDLLSSVHDQVSRFGLTCDRSSLNRAQSLDAINFKSTKSHRQLLTRFNNHVMFGARDGERGWGPGTSKAGTTASAHSSRTVKSDSALSKAVAVNFTPKAKPVLEEGEEDVVTMSTPRGSSSKATKRARKGKQAAENAPRDLSELMHAAEWQNSPADAPFKHRFEVCRRTEAAPTEADERVCSTS